MKAFVALLSLAPLCAQPAHFVSAGVVAGGAFPSTFEATSSPQPLLCGAACYIHYSAPAAKPLTLGAAIEFSLEADGLYHRISYSSVFEYATLSSGGKFR